MGKVTLALVIARRLHTGIRAESEAESMNECVILGNKKI